MQSIRDIFEAHGLRCTRQREQIYQALMATRAHPTAEEICCTVRETEPGLSLATVYNTLEAFSRSGLARRIPCPSGSGACRFDADMSEHAHITTPEGTVIDLPQDLNQKLLDALPGSLLAEIEQRAGIRLRAVNVQFVAMPKAAADRCS